MKLTATITGLSILAATAQASFLDTEQLPVEKPRAGLVTSQGCFSSLASDMTQVVAKDDLNMVSTGYCSKECDEAGASILATSPDGCFCGKSMPPKADLVENEQCSFPCPAYGPEACGGMKPKRWSFWNLGKVLDPPEDESSSSNDQDDDDAESSTTTGSVAATSSSESSTVTGAPSLTRSGDMTSESRTATDTPTTQSDTPEETNGSDEDAESDDPSMGSSLAGSVAAVAAIAGGSMWLLF